jgi:hypothetical protein
MRLALLAGDEGSLGRIKTHGRQRFYIGRTPAIYVLTNFRLNIMAAGTDSRTLRQLRCAESIRYLHRRWLNLSNKTRPDFSLSDPPRILPTAASTRFGTRAHPVNGIRVPDCQASMHGQSIASTVAISL